MTSSGGAQFHGSQIAIGGHNVTQHQYVTADEGASARLAEAVRSVLAALETLGLAVADETTVRRDAQAAGAGTGAAELAHAVLVDLQNALP
ncbi:hypothetical protein HEP84_45825 [Streptomyces sp. RLB1-33]|nr:hypothetical protein [Streptomyces sp. RLB1-33]QIY75288.1 hypothetical protein HEP84_45825 [Streptomyces sp. RLB1-33]